jgi:hypothetical protein
MKRIVADTRYPVMQSGNLSFKNAFSGLMCERKTTSKDLKSLSINSLSEVAIK